MRKLFYFFSAVVIFFSCQSKQFFIFSAEFNIVKTANEAYFKGDRETFNSTFSDNAKIWLNTPRLKSTVLTTIGKQPVGNYDLASVYAGIGEKEFVLKCLENGMMIFLKHWAKLISWYKDDPRIIALEKEIGLGKRLETWSCA